MDERTFTHDGATYRLTWDADTHPTLGTLRCVLGGRVVWSRRIPLPLRQGGHFVHLEWRVLDGCLTLMVDGDRWKICPNETHRYSMTPDGLETLQNSTEHDR